MLVAPGQEHGVEVRGQILEVPTGGHGAGSQPSRHGGPSTLVLCLCRLAGLCTSPRSGWDPCPCRPGVRVTHAGKQGDPQGNGGSSNTLW